MILQIGFSNALSNWHRGVPTVDHRVAPHSIGGADEYAPLEDLNTVFAVHTHYFFIISIPPISLL